MNGNGMARFDITMLVAYGTGYISTGSVGASAERSVI